jgi:hypothetical protein
VVLVLDFEFFGKAAAMWIVWLEEIVDEYGVFENLLTNVDIDVE